MSAKVKNQIEWYNNPNTITSFIIGLIGLIIILSQSFAINNNLSAINILGSILNHNSIYLLVFGYFVLLKTNIGKKYFDFLNIFLILIYGLEAVASLLTIFQSFTLAMLLSLAINFILVIYLIHSFLRNTRVWKSAELSKSPFNEISNDNYFYSILFISITLLAVNLISTTSLDGTILTLMDTGYIILFARYIFLYRKYLDDKNINSNNEGSFDKYSEIIKSEINDFVEEKKLDKKLEATKDKIEDVTSNIKEKVIDIKEEVEEKLQETELDEKLDKAKEKVTDVVSDLKEEIEDTVKKIKKQKKSEKKKIKETR